MLSVLYVDTHITSDQIQALVARFDGLTYDGPATDFVLKTANESFVPMTNITVNELRDKVRFLRGRVEEFELGMVFGASEPGNVEVIVRESRDKEYWPDEIAGRWEPAEIGSYDDLDVELTPASTVSLG